MSIVREIVGNPFRPVAFLPEWCTPPAVELVKQMQAGQDFSQIPVLADAFQAACWEHLGIITYGRDPKATHFRGVLGCRINAR